MIVSQLVTSFRKEIWEFKKTLFWAPFIIAVFMILAPILQLLIIQDYQLSRLFENLTDGNNLVNVKGFARFFLGTVMSVFFPFIIASLVIQLNYFTSCLFDERRDLSVYFWRSLPVSDALTVGVKLITGALVVPAVFMLAATSVVIVFLLVAFIFCCVLSLGYDISLWELWSSAEILGNLIAIWLHLFPYALWMFPVFAWLMLASMFANKAPFLWAVLPVAALLLVESFVAKYWQLDGRFLLDTLREYFTFGQTILPSHMSAGESPKFLLFSVLSTKFSLVATLLGIGLLYLTYWLRVNKSDI